MRHPYRWVTALLLALLPVTALILLAAGTGRAFSAEAEIPPFQTLDRDADGFVSRAEAHEYDAISLLFGVADANRDGRLSPREYRTILSGATTTAGGLRG